METTARKYKKETFIEYAKHIVEGYKTIIAAYGVISKVGLTMHGKVFNKRFESEIEKYCKEEGVNVSIWLNDQYNMGYKDLKIYLQDRSFNGGDCWIYFDNDIYHNSIHNCNNAFVDGNNRIIGVKVAETCNEYIEHCKKEMTKWQDAADNYDKYEEQVKAALKQLNEAFEGLNSLFKPYTISQYDWENEAKKK